MGILSGLFPTAPRDRPASFAGLSGAASALLAAGATDPGRLVVVAPDSVLAQRFAEDLGFFLGSGTARTLHPGGSAPYERLLPDAQAAASRISALINLAGGAGPIVIPAAALVRPVPPPGVFDRWVFSVRSGQELDRDDAVRRLLAMGYQREPVAEEPGDIAVRGGILDVFSPLRGSPVRIELWDDRILSLRAFDPGTQRSVEPLERFDAIPVSELLVDMGERAGFRARLASHLASCPIPARERERVLAQWDEDGAVPGIADLLPVLYGRACYPAEYIPENAFVFLYEPRQIASALADFTSEARNRAGAAFPPPEQVYADPDRTFAALAKRADMASSAFAQVGDKAVRCLPPLPSLIPSSRPDRVAELARMLAEHGAGRVVLAARSRPAADRLLEILGSLKIDLAAVPDFASALGGPLRAIVTGVLSAGFSLPDAGLTLISDSDIFGSPRERRTGRLAAPAWDVPMGALSPGDIVVHVDHGIGRYEGLRQMSMAGWRGDFMHLVYAGGDILYVPVDQMNHVFAYRSAADTPPPLSRLGGSAWKRSKASVGRSLRLMAGELLRISAVRRSAPGTAFPPPDALFREFEASFPWTETPDQERTIAEVLSDMSSPIPMDRLVCGDVGYGKTEVALRAAFLAAEGGRQTAVLVPTTVLAQQHYQNFTERLKDFPVSVGLLSRFVPPSDQRRTLDALAKGEIDIIVGTHRLLSEDVVFASLGLLVVDEEHRFGVRHKERLKKVRETVDVLTLSATPIPRTLFQAFSGLRSLSLIHTPPADRKAVHTEVRYFEEDLIRDAVVRELERGGQVFIVHNRVASIRAFGRMVERLVPEARVGVAHGQMEERELEEVMVRFVRRDLDVLVSTAIVESGLDITNANTLIVNRADRFGLAQLYQLRGRVGRSSTLAYAYLLVPPHGVLGEQAQARLAKLRDLSELGSGFKLAAYDLELRGAGNLLGAEQTGRIEALGLDLFSQLLEQAVREAAGQQPEVQVEPSVTLPMPAYLPEGYLPDVAERLTLYKRLAEARTSEDLEALREETADRFGRFPPEVTGLFERMQVHVLARRLGVERVDAAGADFLVIFHPQARVSPDALVGLLSRDRRVRFIPPVTLRLDASSLPTARDSLGFLMDVLRSLGRSAI